MCEGSLFDRLRVLHCCLDLAPIINLGSYAQVLFYARFESIQQLLSLEDLDLSITGLRTCYDENPENSHYLEFERREPLAEYFDNMFDDLISPLMAGTFAQNIKSFVLHRGAPYGGNTRGMKLLRAPELGLKSFSKNKPHQLIFENLRVEEIPLSKMEEFHLYGFTVSAQALAILKGRLRDSCVIEIQSNPSKEWCTSVGNSSTVLLHPEGHTNTWVRRDRAFGRPHDDEIYLQKQEL